MSQLQTNLENLQEILDKVNNLPEATPSTPTTKQLILNKIDSIGELQGDGTVSETFTHTFEFDPSAAELQLCLNSANHTGLAPIKDYRSEFDNLNSTITLGALNTSWPGVQAKYQNNTLTIQTAANSSNYPPVISFYDYITVICLNDEKNFIDSCIIKIPATHWACYLKDTLITLANNQTKKVQDITYQDDLLVWNFDNGCYTSAKPLWIKQSQIATQYYHCIFEDNSTLDLVGGRNHAHRIFCLDTNRFEYANDCIGKTIMTQNGPMKLLSCDIVEDNVEFYNIITDYHMNCFANKVLTSTGFSNIYPIENMKYIVDTNREIIPIEAFTNCPEEYYYGMRLGEQVNYTMERMDEKIQNMAAIALPKGE